MRRAIHAVIVAGVVLAGCAGENTGPGGDSRQVTTGNQPAAGVVSARRVSGGVEVKNGTTTIVGLAVWNPGFLGLFAPCTSEPGCRSLAPGASVVVAAADIAGYDASMKQVLVRSWPITADEKGALRAGAVTELRLDW